MRRTVRRPHEQCHLLKAVDDEKDRANILSNEYALRTRVMYTPAENLPAIPGDDRAHDGIGGGDLRPLKNCGKAAGIFTWRMICSATPHGAHKVYLVRINRFESAQPHRDGKECGHHNEHHLGQHAVAKPQHQQRSDGDRRMVCVSTLKG